MKTRSYLRSRKRKRVDYLSLNEKGRRSPRMKDSGVPSVTKDKLGNRFQRNRENRTRELNEKERVYRIASKVKRFVGDIRFAQDLLRTYEGSGWRGFASGIGGAAASKKGKLVTPDVELDKARRKILVCKAKIRENMRLLEEFNQSDRPLHPCAWDEDGIDFKHVHCARCCWAQESSLSAVKEERALKKKRRISKAKEKEIRHGIKLELRRKARYFDVVIACTCAAKTSDLNDIM